MADAKAPSSSRKKQERRDEKPKPYRIQQNFTMAHTDVDEIAEIYDAVAQEAIARGFFFEWGTIVNMDPDDVIPDSPIDRVIRGVDDEPR